MWKVRVLKSQVPVFPAVCVGCGESPTTHYKISEDAVGWWSAVRLGWLYGQLTGRTVEVPACEACAVKLRKQRRWRQVIETVLIFAMVGVGLYLFREMAEGWGKRFAVIGLAMLFASPYLVWEVKHPMPIEMTVTDSAVTFTFTNQNYANEFASRNQ